MGRYDVFISHAREDRDGFVLPLVHALEERGIKVWHDAHQVPLIDDLRQEIDLSLAQARLAVVIVSRSFMTSWSEADLSVLLGEGRDFGQGEILPVLFALTQEEVAKEWPFAAALASVSSSLGPEGVAEEIVRAVKRAASPAPNSSAELEVGIDGGTPDLDSTPPWSSADTEELRVDAEPESRSSSRLQSFHDQLNRIPLSRAIVLGLLAGAIVGIATAKMGVVGLLGVTSLVGLALLVGWGAEPIWVEEPISDPEPLDLFEMVAINGGTFWMGSPGKEKGRRDNERRQRVIVSDFHIGETTVTIEHYLKILGLDEAPGSGGPDHPVTEVSWFVAIEFCNQASEQAGFEPCYLVDGEKVVWNREADGYRLPTEAEWEYAARAGTTTRWSFGDDEEELGEYAWFRGNSGGAPHPVAELEPSPWGLFDMHGNVWEWCWDAYTEDLLHGTFASIARRNPSVDKVTTTSVLRVLRGGSFWLGPEVLRSALRGRGEPGDQVRGVGFRCVRGAHPQPRLLPFDLFGLFARSAHSPK